MEQPNGPLWDGNVFLEKPLPSSEESEKSILGAILLDNDVISQAIGEITSEDFYSPLNKKIFEAMVVLFNSAKPIDPILIGEELKKNGSLSWIGGVSVVTQLAFGLPHNANIEEYVQIVKDKSILRRMVRTLMSLQSTILAEEDEPRVLIDRVEQQIYGISTSTVQSGFVQIIEPLDTSIALAHLRAEQGTVVTGLSSGFIDLDQKLQGFHRGHQIILAARPSIGKTALMAGIAQNAAIRGGKTVAIFSLEMSKEEMMDRLVCSEVGIDGFRYTSGQLTQEEWVKVEECRHSLLETDLYIDDTPNLNTSMMRAKLRRLRSSINKEIDLIEIDYLQLMSGDDPRSREREVSKISRELKIMAREFNTPIITLSQLNRNSENRSNHRPAMSDLRESGAIEQDADVVAFIYREDFYQEAPSLHTNVAEIIIAKNRRGATGVVSLGYNGPHTKFTNLTLTQEF